MTYQVVNLYNMRSFYRVGRNSDKNNFLLWIRLRHSVPFGLRHTNYQSTATNSSYQYSNNLFDVTKKKSKYNMLLVSPKEQFPNHAANLKRDFDFDGGG